MIKTFEQFKRSTIKPIYSSEEFEAICDIVSDYYDGDNIDDFINSPDAEAKEEFIEDNEIDNLRVCQHCGKFIVEGYLYRDFETFCSEECFVNEYGRKTYDEADDDELYWTAWEG